MKIGRAVMLLLERVGRTRLASLRGSPLSREHVAASKAIARQLLEELDEASELDGFADLRDALEASDASPLRGDRDPARRAEFGRCG